MTAKTHNPHLSPTSDGEFVDGDGLIGEIDADPSQRAGVDDVLAAMYRAEIEHAHGLQSLRASFNLTQVALAAALGVSQGNVAQTEARSDLLLSTLRRHVEAITGGSLHLVIVREGHAPIEFELAEISTNA